MRFTEDMPGVVVEGPMEIVGRSPIRPTIFAESVAISGEALLIGMLVLLVLAILGIAGLAALVYLGAHLATRFRQRNTTEVAGGPAPLGSRAPIGPPPPPDEIPAVPYDPGMTPHRVGRSGRRPIAVWLWVLCTAVSIALILALPWVWFVGLLAAPLLGALGAEVTRRIDGRP
ncbi:MAG: hypothetical protein M5U19_03070 [Microthrixaceae bacterium]|nr:hypothetical protein [Microthrixaceae bacterium]